MIFFQHFVLLRCNLSDKVPKSRIWRPSIIPPTPRIWHFRDTRNWARLKQLFLAWLHGSLPLFWDWLLFLQAWVKVNIWKTRKLYIIKPLFVCSLERSFFSKLASMKIANLKILTKQNYFGLYFEIYVKILTLFKISDFCYITIFRG